MGLLYSCCWVSRRETFRFTREPLASVCVRNAPERRGMRSGDLQQHLRDSNGQAPRGEGTDARDRQGRCAQEGSAVSPTHGGSAGGSVPQENENLET